MKYIFLIIFSICGLVTYTQKVDNIWMAGYNSVDGYETIIDHWFGISKFDFNQQPIQLTRDSLGIQFGRSNSTISNFNGDNILFYCNGKEVRNGLDEIIQNGDSLGYINGGWYVSNYGVPLLMQHHLILPSPINGNEYDIIHCFVDSFHDQVGLNIGGKKLLLSSVSTVSNNLHGEIVSKNQIISNEENSICIAAVRHGNGCFWHVVYNKANTNCYDVLIYDGSFFTSNTYCGGAISRRGYLVPERFSPNGTIFASSTANNNSINIFNFDRCTGELNLKESFKIPELDSLHSYCSSLEFSPNSRFLYVFTERRIYQFDVSSPNVQPTKRVIAISDDSFGCPLGMYWLQSQLAPDGKIYANSGNTNYCISVINTPDELGDSCHFILNYELPTVIDGLPYYPNYRLGALAGSGCDTLTAINDKAEKEKILKVFPNPAIDAVTIDYGYTNWEKGDVDLEITNSAGELIYSQHLPMYSGFQRLDVTSYANGIYTVAIKRGNTIVATSQFVKK